MENEDEKGEYVLNEMGYIWIGSARHNYGRPWNFGQVSKKTFKTQYSSSCVLKFYLLWDLWKFVFLTSLSYCWDKMYNSMVEI